jgi:hypothetical protein
MLPLSITREKVRHVKKDIAIKGPVRNKGADIPGFPIKHPANFESITLKGSQEPQQRFMVPKKPAEVPYRCGGGLGVTFSGSCEPMEGRVHRRVFQDGFGMRTCKFQTGNS